MITIGHDYENLVDSDDNIKRFASFCHLEFKFTTLNHF